MLSRKLVSYCLGSACHHHDFNLHDSTTLFKWTSRKNDKRAVKVIREFSSFLINFFLIIREGFKILSWSATKWKDSVKRKLRRLSSKLWEFMREIVRVHKRICGSSKASAGNFFDKLRASRLIPILIASWFMTSVWFRHKIWDWMSQSGESARAMLIDF